MRRIAAISVALLALQSCEAGSMEAGVITGVVKLGPIMPVCREGVPCFGVYKEAPVVLRASDGRVVKRGTTNDRGEFLLSAPPGSYDVVVGVEGQLLPTCTPKRVSVRVRETVRVEIDCDSGIR